jgi:predicted metalloprotease
MSWRKLLLPLFALALLAAACGGSKSADPPATTAEAGEGGDPREEYVAPPYDELIELSIADIQYFWGEQYPELYDERYESIPPNRIHAGSPDDPPPACGGGTPSYEEVEENAFYCSIGDFVAWDDVGLFPRLYEESGAYSVSLVLAHEWGHAIQGRTGLLGVNSTVPTIVTELQADCFAGAWTRRLADGENERLEFDPTALEQALSGMISFGDSPGGDPLAPGAHGSGFDRVNAFQEGFEDGGERCVEYGEANSAGVFDQLPTIVEFPFTDAIDAATGGNLALPVLLRDLLPELNDYWSNTVEFEEIDELVPFDSGEGDESSCDGVYKPNNTEFAVFYCAEDNSIHYDEQLFVLINREIGDFGVGTLITMEFARAAQHQADFEAEDFDTIKQRACFSGAFGRFMLERDPATLEEGQLALSPGDLDEAIQAFLRFPPTDSNMQEYGSVFELVTAFRDGVFNQEEACEAYI